MWYKRKQHNAAQPFLPLDIHSGALNIFACWWYSKRWLKLKRLRVLFNYINNLLYSLYHPCFVYYRSHTNSPIKQTNFPPTITFLPPLWSIYIFIIKVWSPIPKEKWFSAKRCVYVDDVHTIFVRILPKILYYFIYLYVMNSVKMMEWWINTANYAYRESGGTFRWVLVDYNILTW